VRAFLFMAAFPEIYVHVLFISLSVCFIFIVL
jgi:hypothetical protein